MKTIQKREELTNRVEHRGPDPSLLQTEGTDQAGHPSADDPDHRVAGEWAGEGHLFLAEGLLQGGPPRRAVGGFSRLPTASGSGLAVHGIGGFLAGVCGPCGGGFVFCPANKGYGSGFVVIWRFMGVKE